MEKVIFEIGETLKKKKKTVISLLTFWDCFIAERLETQ